MATITSITLTLEDGEWCEDKSRVSRSTTKVIEPSQQTTFSFRLSTVNSRSMTAPQFYTNSTIMDQYSTQSEDSGHDNAYSLGPRRQNMGRDPVSHRIIEKRRRDRMNQCLTQLSHLLPKSYTEKRCGRIEKTEIVELAIQYIKYLVSIPKSNGEDGGPANTNQQLPFVQGFCQCASEVMHFAASSKNADPSCASEYFLARLRYHLENVCTGMGTDTKLEDWLRDVDNMLNLPLTRGDDGRDEDHFDRPGDGMSCSKRQCLPNNSYQTEFTRTSTSCSTSDDGLHDRNKSVYKFKDRMKQRFTGGHSSSDSSNSPQPNTSDSNTDSDNKQESPRHEVEVEDDEPCIPCFALFANKSNYTPIAVPAQLLRKYVQSQNANRSSAVHPISITVEYGDGTVIKQEMI